MPERHRTHGRVPRGGAAANADAHSTSADPDGDADPLARPDATAGRPDGDTYAYRRADHEPVAFAYGQRANRHSHAASHFGAVHTDAGGRADADACGDTDGVSFAGCTGRPVGWTRRSAGGRRPAGRGSDAHRRPRVCWCADDAHANSDRGKPDRLSQPDTRGYRNRHADSRCHHLGGAYLDTGRGRRRNDDQ
jgi:hypothetical protein